MKYVCALIVTADLERSKQFYQQVMGSRITADFGANVTMDGGFCLQTLDSFKTFLHTDNITLGGNDAELYFETQDLDAFMETLSGRPEIQLVHPLQTHPWGQRAVRLYDPDKHIIEVGESLTATARRFASQGMSEGQIARRMDVSQEYVSVCLARETT